MAARAEGWEKHRDASQGYRHAVIKMKMFWGPNVYSADKQLMILCCLLEV
jgi:hypothetical protein